MKEVDSLADKPQKRTDAGKIVKGGKDGRSSAKEGGYHTGNQDPDKRGHGDPDAHPQR